MSWSVADTAKTGNTKRNVRFDSQERLDQILDSLDNLAQSLPDNNRKNDSPENRANDTRNAKLRNGEHNYGENRGFSSSNNSLNYSEKTRSSKPNSISIPVTMDSEANSVFPSVRATRRRLRSDDYNQSSDYYRRDDEPDAILGQPYHTVADSKPFSYIRSHSSNSRPVSRSSQSSLDRSRARLRSPALLRRALGTDLSDDIDDVDSEEPSPWLLEQQRKLRLRQQQREQQQREQQQYRSRQPSRPSSALSSSYAHLMGNSEPGTRETSPFPSDSKQHVYSVPIHLDNNNQSNLNYTHNYTNNYSNNDVNNYTNNCSTNDAKNKDHYGTWNTIRNQKLDANKEDRRAETANSSFGHTNYESNSNDIRWNPSRLVRQKSDSAFDRALTKRRLRHLDPRRSPARDELDLLNLAARKLNASIGSNLDLKSSSSRPQTPSFPASGTATPYANRGRRASSVSSVSTATPMSVSTPGSKRTWYRPELNRDQVVQILESCREGAFVIRDSRTYPGAFGLALRVDDDLCNSNEAMVRHFLIEPVRNGVKLRGYGSEPIFSSLAALVHQHTIAKLALPTLLKVENCPAEQSTPNVMQSDSRHEVAQHLLQVGAACDLLYLHSAPTGKLTGPAALARAMDDFVAGSAMDVVKVHFKINGQGLIITDCGRQNFFRQFFACSNISYCGFEPQGRVVRGKPVLGIVAKDVKGDGSNRAHVFAEGDQPVHSVVGFVNKVLSVVNNRDNY